MTAAVALTTAERVAKRAQILADCLRRAEADARRISRSTTCYDGRHDTCVGHLRTNGGSCVCECHDEEPA